MSHEIFGERFVGARQPAWHGLGTVFTDPLNASQAIQLGCIDYEVNKYPLVADMGDGTYENTPVFGIFREPTVDSPKAVFFGKVAKEYQIIQNMEIARIIDPITELWKVETAGALYEGKLLFLTLDAGEIEIKGDLVHQFFMVSDYKGGGRALRIDTTPVRVVCGNTYRMGISETTMTLNLNHAHKPKEKLEAVAQTIVRMQASQATIYTILESIANKKSTNKQVNAWLETLYPLPKEPEEGAVVSIDTRNAFYAKESRIKEIRDAVIGLYKKFNDENPKVSATCYAFYNAVVEMEDYRKGKNPQVDALFGGRASLKMKAFDLVLRS